MTASALRSGRSWAPALVAMAAALGFVASVALGVERYARDGVAAISPFRYQTLLATEKAPRIAVLAVGDSHTGMGFFSERDDVQSVGWGENLAETRAKLDYLLPRLPALRVVLLQLDPHMFFPHRDRGVGPLHRQLLGEGEAFHPFAGRLLEFDPCCRAQMPGYALRRALGLKAATPDPVVHPNGYLEYRYDSPLTLREQAVKEVASYGELRTVPQVQARYEAILRLLRERGLTVALTRYPLSAGYHATLPAQWWQATADYGAALARRDPALRACGSWEARPDGDFLNTDHLNLAGARGYWPTLAACIDAIGR